MYAMLVTLDVLKLTGWLNADASCRGAKGEAVERRGRHAGPGEGLRGVVGVAAAQAACRE